MSFKKIADVFLWKKKRKKREKKRKMWQVKNTRTVDDRFVNLSITTRRRNDYHYLLPTIDRFTFSFVDTNQSAEPIRFRLRFNCTVIMQAFVYLSFYFDFLISITIIIFDLNDNNNNNNLMRTITTIIMYIYIMIIKIEPRICRKIEIYTCIREET